MDKQSNKIDQLFQAALHSEPDLGDQMFTDAVMQRVGKVSSVSLMTARKEKAILWLAGMLGALFAVSLFPVAEFVELLTVFTSGVTLPKLGFVTLLISVLTFSAYWVVETDAI